MGNRRKSRLGTFAVGAVLVAAVFAFSPLIGPALASAPGAFKALLASAADAGPLEVAAQGSSAVGQGAPAVDDIAATGDRSVPARPDDAVPMLVDYVHDGDTLFLLPVDAAGNATGSDRVKVRLIGLDTPEVSDVPECFGQEATEQLRAMLPEGSAVWARADREPADTYGRSLLYLWTADGRFVNYELVAGGAAETLTVPPNDANADLLLAAETAARSSGAGRWGAC